MRGYYSFYLNDVQREMGVLFHTAFTTRHEFTDTEAFVQAFLNSKAVWGIEHQHPKWLAGSSGVEWYMEILDDLGIKYTQKEMQEACFYSADDAYWCGWVIAFYQWLNAIPFKEILRPGILNQLFERYILHEADISVAVGMLDNLLGRVSEGKDDPFGEEYIPDYF